MEKNFEIGRIVNTQGLKGDVRVVPTTDDQKRFELLKSVIIEQKKGSIELNIERVSYNKKFVIIKFKEINDMTAAENLKNTIITIPPSLALPLNEDEYYIRDLYEMNVETEDGENLGVLKDIIHTGANDVYIIKNNDATIKDLLIPAIKQCIIKVDKTNNKMIVRLMKGLRD